MREYLTPWDQIEPALQQEILDMEPFLNLFNLVPDDLQELEEMFANVLRANIREIENIRIFLKDRL